MVDFALGFLCAALIAMGLRRPAPVKKPQRAVEREETGVVKGDGEGDEVFVIDE